MNTAAEPGYYTSNITTDVPVVITTSDLPKVPQTESEPLPIQQRVLQTQYFRTCQGKLKLIQLLFGLISIILVAVGFKKDYYYTNNSSDSIFLILLIAAFYFTFCLLFTNLIPLKSGKILPKPKHELIYNWVMSILLFTISIIFLAESGGYFYSTNAAGGAFGIINSFVYLAHTYLSYSCI